MSIIVCHGGSSSNPAYEDGPLRACRTGFEMIDQGKNAIDAVIAATQNLEDDERFNAGSGSNLRLDGTTIQMDASCMTSTGLFAAVAAIERVKNPIAVARRLLDTPHILLVGDGATNYARQCGFDDYDPTTSRAKKRLQKVLSVGGKLDEWSRADLEQAWNFETPLREVLGTDTVGSVAWDGQTFASALSSGGTTIVLRGRVGDVPLPGCGLYAGKAGAIATTGDGEYIARSLLAYRAYLELEKGQSPEQTVNWALNELAESVDIGIIVVNHTGYAGGARHGMAWHGQSARESA
ncbi:isoaspartyl peptidase/L-asparaginase [uncultured Gimesia sp.]|uniref:isoaspartyl peptidase/L-asparaginase n=1 Tax=uncultured Gimesia sp. TaxID=1678688 RepID=UPI00260F9F4F|nr:isoaspartyl peptidase/L-asparaginase [uncultured Gimesia sp.]